jgi:predicted alpha-1,2-mannosidase
VGAVLIVVSLVAETAACPAPNQSSPLKKAPPLVELVDPTIGTGGFGYGYGATFLGAAAPHGMVKVGPDTTGSFGEIRFLHYSGNWAEDPTILCFSHTHLHGTGVPDGGAVALMPTTSFQPERPRAVSYAATRVDERAYPGSYAVRLAEPDIRVELAATPRTASHRLTFPEGTNDAVVVVDLARVITGGVVSDAALRTRDDRSLVGSLHMTGDLSPPQGYRIFFVITADAPFSTTTSVDGAAFSLTDGEAHGVEVATALHFGVRGSDQPVHLRVALSFVDEEGALANLAAERPQGTHDELVRAAKHAWHEVLGAITLYERADDESSAKDRTQFASALYRTFLMPSVLSDADGRWRGPDDVIRTAQGFSMMTDLSLWDTYRSVQPLYALVAPTSARDVALSLVAFTAAAGFSPVWPMATGDADVMIGSPAEPTLGDAVARGVVSAEEVAEAWPVLRAAALELDEEPAAGRQGRGDVVVYDAHGYVPTTRNGSVSATLEYAVADDALAVIAMALSAPHDAERLRARAHGWRLLYDPETGFLRGRDEQGLWRVSDDAFDPTEFGEDYVEANAWQSLFPLDDLEGIRLVYGGNDGALRRLRTLFDATVLDWATRDRSSELFGVQPLPFHWQGNEPSLHVSALAYDLGDRDLGFEFVDWVRTTQYGYGVDGLPGNDDGGATSAWLVQALLGLHPVPGSDAWVVGTPHFPRVELGTGPKTLAIVRAAGTKNDVTIDDEPLTSPRISHGRLARGGVLRVSK